MPARPRPRLRPHPTDPDQARPRPDHERIATCEGKLAPGKQINTADNRATTCWGSWTLDSKQHSRRRDHELLGQLGPRKTNDTAGRWTATCRDGLAPGKRINTLGRRSTTCRGATGPNDNKSPNPHAGPRPARCDEHKKKRLNASGRKTTTCWAQLGPGKTNQRKRKRDPDLLGGQLALEKQISTAGHTTQPAGQLGQGKRINTAGYTTKT